MRLQFLGADHVGRRSVFIAVFSLEPSARRTLAHTAILTVIKCQHLEEFDQLTIFPFPFDSCPDHSACSELTTRRADLWQKSELSVVISEWQTIPSSSFGRSITRQAEGRVVRFVR